MPRKVLDSGTAHILLEVSKAPADMGVDKLNLHVDKAMYALRRQLQYEGKLVKRCYKTLFGFDVKVWAEWVVLAPKEKREKRKAAEVAQ